MKADSAKYDRLAKEMIKEMTAELGAITMLRDLEVELTGNGEEPHRDDSQGSGQHHQIQTQTVDGLSEQEPGVVTDSCVETEPHQREVRCEGRG